MCGRYRFRGEQEGKTLLDAMRDGDTEGMQRFDGEIEKLIRAGTIDLETGLAYATNPANLGLQLADLSEGAPSGTASATPADRRYPLNLHCHSGSSLPRSYA